MDAAGVEMKGQASADISQQAAAWFVSNHNPDEARARAQEFLAWLRRSPEHVQEYLAVAQLARALGDCAEAPPIEQLVREAGTATENVVPLHGFRPPSARPQRVQWSRRRALPALAASFIVAIIGLAVWFSSAIPRPQASVAQYITRHGEQRSLKLPDGSMIHLNSDSEVKVGFDATQRRVELLAGQALFDVEKDPGRPFKVIAGSTEVVAVGTLFEVYRRGDATLVTVVEGEVAVSANPLAGGASESPGKVALVAGQRLRVPQVVDAAANESIEVPEIVNVRETIAWPRLQIVVDSRPLGEVVQEFNRHATPTIVIDDPGLAGRRISGVFDVHDGDNFLEFIRRMDHVVVATYEDSVRLILDNN